MYCTIANNTKQDRTKLTVFSKLNIAFKHKIRDIRTMHLFFAVYITGTQLRIPIPVLQTILISVSVLNFTAV